VSGGSLSLPALRVMRSSVSALVGIASRSAKRWPALPAERQSQAALQAAQALGPPSSGRCNTGQALGEGLAGAGRIKAAEPSRLDTQQHRAALPRQVAQEQQF